VRSIAKVFGRSPFVPLQTHMDKVAQCVERIPEIFEAYERGETETVATLAKLVSKLEHEADIVKVDIRNSLPRGLFMPVDRSNLLTILKRQDDIADTAENISVVLTFKHARAIEPFQTMFREFLAKNIEAFDGVQRIIGELDELLETGFGGAEAEKVREMVDEVAHKEYQVDKLQRELLRELLAHEDELSYGDFFIWSRLIRQVSEISDLAENLADSVRLTLESK
jgi:predicted phosphate transport protein (TIGR00153 family)